MLGVQLRVDCIERLLYTRFDRLHVNVYRGVRLAVTQEDGLHIFDAALGLGQRRHGAPQYLEIQLRQTEPRR